MLYLEDKRKVRLFEITGMEGTEVEKAFKVILEVFQKAHDIGNCQTIKYVIRLLDETSVVGKQEH